MTKMSDEPDASSSAGTPRESVARFVKAYAEFERSLHTIWNTNNIPDRVASVNRKYADQTRALAPSPEAHQRVSAAHQRWLTAGGTAGPDDEGREALVEAYRQYLRSL